MFFAVAFLGVSSGPPGAQSRLPQLWKITSESMIYFGFDKGHHVIVTVDVIKFNTVDATALLLTILFAKYDGLILNLFRSSNRPVNVRVCQIDEKFSTEHFIQPWS